MARSLKIDHVTLAASQLQVLQDAFAQIGLATDYGGVHSNGVTHMSLVGFDDGSYIELISTLTPGTHAPWWPAHIAADAGPCAWSIQVDDVSAEVSRLSMLGVPVSGPTYMQRKRPDGRMVEWDLASVGDGEIGTVHPFVIKDRTPRHWRVAPTNSVSGSELTGAAIVVIGVRDLESSIATFRKTYGLAKPRSIRSEHLLAQVALFEDQPLASGDSTRPGKFARSTSGSAGRLADRDSDRQQGISDFATQIQVRPGGTVGHESGRLVRSRSSPVRGARCRGLQNVAPIDKPIVRGRFRFVSVPGGKRNMFG